LLIFCDIAKLNGVAVAVTETPLAETEEEVDSLGTVETGTRQGTRRTNDEKPVKDKSMIVLSNILCNIE